MPDSDKQALNLPAESSVRAWSKRMLLGGRPHDSSPQKTDWIVVDDPSDMGRRKPARRLTG
eukprot:1822276-Prymnesium_polylepis.1